MDSTGVTILQMHGSVQTSIFDQEFEYRGIVDICVTVLVILSET